MLALAPAVSRQIASKVGASILGWLPLLLAALGFCWRPLVGRIVLLLVAALGVAEFGLIGV